jgi:phospholipid-binding lipoprotein MlaA
MPAMRKVIFCLVALLLLPCFRSSIHAAEPAAGKEAAEAGPAGEYYGDLFDTSEEEVVTIADPLQPLNRGIFWVNDKLYFYLFKPVARVYRVVPEPARVSVSNFFRNVDTPIRFVNCLLQVKFSDAGTELLRFVINSTVGIGGLFDPAKKYWGLKRKVEDLGQTFGYYGVGQGFYLVLPVLGPSSARDGVGWVGDLFLDPWTYLDDNLVYFAVKGADIETEISLDKDTYEQIRKESLDPYVTFRNAYAQHRQQAVSQ